MQKHPALPKMGLAIDWETSGYSTPDYAAEHQGISFGAVIYDIETFEPVDVMYREIKFSDKYKWEAGAEKVHGLSREHLESAGISQEEAAIDLASMVLKYLGTDKVVLLGHRVYFDEAFTKQLLNTVDMSIEFDPIRIDSAAISLAFLNMTRSDIIFETMGYPARKEHNALDDILMTLGTIRQLKGYLIDGLIKATAEPS
jgi:DNA polymerase III epsilon subunit-like protein